MSVLGFVIYLSGITGGYDVTLLAYLIDTLLLSMLIFKGKIFNTLDFAMDLAIDSLAEGLIVINDQAELMKAFKEQAESVNQAKSDFVSSMSHEIQIRTAA